MTDTLVYVSPQPSEGAEPALAEPTFVIEHEGKLYLTRAVWEYDADDSASDEVKAGVRQLREVFDAHVGSDAKRAVAVPPLLKGIHYFVDSRPGHPSHGGA